MGVGGRKISFYLHCFTCSLCWGFFSSMMIAWHSIFIVYCDIKKKTQNKKPNQNTSYLAALGYVYRDRYRQMQACLSVLQTGQTWASSDPKSHTETSTRHLGFEVTSRVEQPKCTLDFGQQLALTGLGHSQGILGLLVLVQVVRLQKPSRTNTGTTVTAENSPFNVLIM